MRKFCFPYEGDHRPGAMVGAKVYSIETGKRLATVIEAESIPGGFRLVIDKEVYETVEMVIPDKCRLMANTKGAACTTEIKTLMRRGKLHQGHGLTLYKDKSLKEDGGG